MASKVLKELEELRSMLAQPTPSMTTATSGAASTFSSLSAPLLLSAADTPGFTTPSWTTPLSTFRTAPAEAAAATEAAGPYLVKGSSSPGRLGGLAAPLVPRLDLRSCVTEVGGYAGLPECVKADQMMMHRGQHLNFCNCAS